MKGLTIDTGALIAFELNDRLMVRIINTARAAEVEIVVPAGVVAQAWRDGTRQVRLARLLRASDVFVEALDDSRAREAGQLCGTTRTRDVIDATVVLCARRRGHRVVTSDAKDLERLDPNLELVEI